METILRLGTRTARYGLVALICWGIPARADNATYNYIGGAAGYGGTIVLDASASPSGGGSVADIVSITVTTPTFGTVTYDPAFAQVSNPFVWDSAGISAMNIKWYMQPAPPFSNYAVVNAGVVFDYVLAAESGVTAQDRLGKWMAAPAAPAFNLTIHLADANAVISWSTNADAYQLQTGSDFGGNSTWSALTNVPSIAGTNYQVAVPLVAAPQFFRLQGN